MAELPTWDQAVSAPPQGLPSWDDALAAPDKDEAPKVGPLFSSAPEVSDIKPPVAEYLKNRPEGKIASAFGHGFGEAFDAGTIGLSKDDLKDLKIDNETLNDLNGWHKKFAYGARDGLIVPSAFAMNAAYRGVAGVFSGVEEAVGAVAGETGIPGAEKEAKFTFESAGEGFPLGKGSLGIPTPKALPRPIAEARSLAVIGEGEKGYFGLGDPTPAELTERHAAAAEVHTPIEPPPLSVHEIARNLAPETFAEYDDLSTRRDTMGGWIRDLNEKRRSDAEASAPHNAEIAELQAKMEDANPRKSKIYQDKIDTLVQKNKDYVESEITKDNPDLARVRADYQKIDYRMRDMAEEVSAAYREAKTHLPEEIPEEPTVTPEVVAPQEPHGLKLSAEAQMAELEKQHDALPEGSPERDAIKEQMAKLSEQAVKKYKPASVTHPIVSDVTKKLTAAGRPEEEARAAAQLVKAHYDARSQRFGGKKGTAEEMYERDMADIKAGKNRARILQNRELGQNEPPPTNTSKLLSDVFANVKKAYKKLSDATKHEVERWGSFNWTTSKLEKAFADDAHPELRDDIEKAFAPIREQIREKFGDTIRLYRGQVRIRPGFEADQGRALFSWTSDPKIAKEFAHGALYREITDAEVAAAVEQYNRTGFANLRGTRYMRSKTNPAYYDIYRGREHITDGDHANFAQAMKDRQADIKEINDRNRDKGKPVYADVPVDDIVWIHDIEHQKEFITTRNPLDYQDKEYAQGARGKIRLATEESKAMITLFKSADASTFIHETGHHWLDELMRDASDMEAPQDLLNDAKTVRDWLGVTEGAEIPTKAHEKFARGFERYMMEGVAPTKELAGIFAKFKDWLTKLYQMVEKLKSPITDDIRHVFDRLLSVENKKPIVAEERVQPTAEAAEPSAAGIPPPEGTVPPAEKGPPTTATATLPKAASEFVDKAGNIRLENLNTPEDVNVLVREIADQNEGFMASRGVIPDDMVMSFAEAAGIEAWEVDLKALAEKFGYGNLSSMIIGGRKLFIDSATKLRDAMNKAATGDDEAVMAYAEARARHIMIQEHLSAVTAETGRALRAFHEIGGGAEDAQMLGEFLKQNTGKTLMQLKEEAALGAKLDTPQKVSKFINDSKGGRAKAMILEYYINALISGPITHFRYSVGNALNALWTPLVEIPVASAISTTREALTGKQSDRVYMGEAGAQLHALLKGSKDGLYAAATAFKTGISPALPGEKISPMFAQRINTIPGTGGKIINLPSKSVAAIHSFFKSIRYEQNIQGLAYRQALKEGLLEGSDNFTNRIADLTTSPPEDMMKAATGDALKELFMSPSDYSGAMGSLTRFTNQSLLAKIIMPFMKIGSQITRNAFVERTPLGIGSGKVRGAITAGGAASDFQLAKMATGVALMGTMALLVTEGNATGDGPADPSQRAVWLLNHRPNSIKIGDITIPYQGLGHLGMLMRFSANMTETAQGWNEEEGGKLAVAFMEGLTKSVLDENFMRGLKDMLDAVYHPAEYGPNYVRTFATNWLPFSVGLGQMDRKIDPYQRESHTLFDAARARIPFASEGLLPRRDRFGEPIPNGGALDMYKNDPVVNRMEALHMGIGKPERKIRGVELTDKQYDDYTRLSGRMAKMRLDSIVKIPGFISMPDFAQIKIITKTIENSRETARSLVMMQNPEIIKQATDNKLQAMQGTKP